MKKPLTKKTRERRAKKNYLASYHGLAIDAKPELQVTP
jgi:hypothetical protein